MSRDFRKLRVFQVADERYSLQTQLRRAALSVPANIVEGSARRTTREYLNFINIAAGSATEARYLADVARRLGYIPEGEGAELVRRYTRALGPTTSAARGPEPGPISLKS